jgi:hypothetical protein
MTSWAAHSATCRKSAGGTRHAAHRLQEVTIVTIQTPPGGIDEPDMPDPTPDPEPVPPEPEPGGPVPEGGVPPMSAPGAEEGPPMRMPHDNPEVETEI